MASSNENPKNSIVPPVIPPIFRFLTELTTWGWFILAAISINILYVIGFLVSVLALALFNFPGDKNQKGPIYVPGFVRISIEIFSGLLGIYGAWVLLSEVGLLFQIPLTVIAYILDFERWSWLLGFRTLPPESVTRTHTSK